MSKPDPLAPTSDRPRWETDPAPAELVEVLGDAVAALSPFCSPSARPGASLLLDALAAPENRAALIAWLIAEGIAVQPTISPLSVDYWWPKDPPRPRVEDLGDGDVVVTNDPQHGRPLFLLDGAP